MTKKSISVVNIETGEIVVFESQAEFARTISVNRATINKWNKKRILKGVWIYKERPDKSLKKHQEFLLTYRKNKKCPQCHIILALDVEICPICNTRQ
jgi:hypothetical protein